VAGIRQNVDPPNLISREHRGFGHTTTTFHLCLTELQCYSHRGNCALDDNSTTNAQEWPET
jgi:hypothetical protein